MKRFCLPFLSLLLLPGLCALGQTRVRGTVTDAQTGEPLPYVSVVFPGTQTGTMTDTEGAFSLESSHSYASVSFQMLGYETLIASIRPGALNAGLDAMLVNRWKIEKADIPNTVTFVMSSLRDVINIL